MRLHNVRWMVAVALLLATGCMPRQISLTASEERKLAELGRALHAEVWLQYDYDAVEEGRQGGKLGIGIEQANRSLEKTLCQVDSAGLRSAQFTIKALFPLLRFRGNHDSVTVHLFAVHREKSGNDEFMHTECAKQFVARLKPSNVQFRLVSRSSDKPNWYW